MAGKWESACARTTYVPYPSRCVDRITRYQPLKTLLMTITINARDTPPSAAARRRRLPCVATEVSSPFGPGAYTAHVILIKNRGRRYHDRIRSGRPQAAVAQKVFRNVVRDGRSHRRWARPSSTSRWRTAATVVRIAAAACSGTARRRFRSAAAAAHRRGRPAHSSVRRTHVCRRFDGFPWVYPLDDDNIIIWAGCTMSVHHIHIIFYVKYNINYLFFLSRFKLLITYLLNDNINF